MALNVSNTEILAPPFRTGQPLANSTAVSSVSAYLSCISPKAFQRFFYSIIKPFLFFNRIFGRV